MQWDPEHDPYGACEGLVYHLMNISLPELWRTKRDHALWIQGWLKDQQTVAPFDRFAAWESQMSVSFPEVMQETYTKLQFDRNKEARVVSPKGTDWTFLVYVIRYEFLKHQLASGIRQPIRDHALNMQLLDQIERYMTDNTTRHRTPSPNAAPRRDTPELEKEPENTAYNRSLLARLPEPNIDSMLARLHYFIE
jgi:hypothetical protein